MLLKTDFRLVSNQVSQENPHCYDVVVAISHTNYWHEVFLIPIIELFLLLKMRMLVGDKRKEMVAS